MRPIADTVTVRVADTSRTMRPGEIDGEEYHFVSRDVMENDILNKR